MPEPVLGVQSSRLKWRNSTRYLATRRQHAKQERKLAAHRKSLHGKLAHDIGRRGNQVQIEKISFKGWQRVYGKSVGLRAPGMFIDHLKRTVAKTGGTLIEVPTSKTKLSQYCHGCQTYTKKPLSERWHECACGIGPVQRDLYSAWLLAYWMRKNSFPPSPMKHGKVRNCACEPRWSAYKNVRVRGSPSPKAWV